MICADVLKVKRAPEQMLFNVIIIHFHTQHILSFMLLFYHTSSHIIFIMFVSLFLHNIQRSLDHIISSYVTVHAFLCIAMLLSYISLASIIKIFIQRY